MTRCGFCGAGSDPTGSPRCSCHEDRVPFERGDRVRVTGEVDCLPLRIDGTVLSLRGDELEVVCDAGAEGEDPRRTFEFYENAWRVGGGAPVEIVLVRS